MVNSGKGVAFVTPFFYIKSMAARKDTLEDYIAEILSMRNNLGKTIQETIKKNSGIWLLKPLKLRLFNTGTDGKGNVFPDYDEYTKIRRRRKGLRTSPTSLRYTGKFYASMHVNVQASPFKTRIEVVSNDNPKKVQDLTLRYGDDILSLTEEEEEFVAKQLSNKLIKDINNLKLPSINFK